MPQDQNPTNPELNANAAVEKAAEPAPGGRTRAVFFAMLVAMAAVVILFLKDLKWYGVPLAFMNLARMAQQPWQFPTGAARGLAVGGAMAAAMFGAGYGMIRAFRPWRRMAPLAWERAALALPVAALPVSLAVLGLGLAGFTGRGVYGALLAALALAGVVGWKHFIRDLRRGGWRALRRALAAQPALMLAMMAALLALSLIYALTPAIQSDELRYHLAAPAAWLRDGRIHYLHHQAFSNFPMLGEMLFMMGLRLGGDEAARLMHWAFLPSCVGLIALVARRLIGRVRPGWGLAAGAAFVFIPTVPILAAWCFIEIIVTAYVLAFVYLAGRALERPRRGAGTLVGLTTAAGISAKYTLLGLMGALGALWLGALLLAGAGARRTARLGLAVALVTLALGGPWYLKNCAWTGNPFYPGATSIFGEGEWTRQNQAFFVNKAHEKGMHLKRPEGMAGKAVEFVISPVTTAFFPEKFEDNALGALPLLGLLAGLGWLAAGGENRLRYRARARARFFRWWIGLAIVVSWGMWFVTYQSNRFLLPTAGLALAWGAAGAAELCRRMGPGLWRSALRWLALAAAAHAFLFTMLQMLSIFQNPATGGLDTAKIDAVAVGLGFKSREDFLRQQVSYWGAARWLARRARTGEKALLVGEHRTMHFELPVVASDWFDTPQPLPWIRATKNNDEMLDRMLKEGIHYIFWSPDVLRQADKRGRGYFQARFGSTEWERFKTLWENPRLAQIYPGAERERIFIYQVAGAGDR